MTRSQSAMLVAAVLNLLAIPLTLGLGLGLYATTVVRANSELLHLQEAGAVAEEVRLHTLLPYFQQQTFDWSFVVACGFAINAGVFVVLAWTSRRGPAPTPTDPLKVRLPKHLTGTRRPTALCSP